MRVLSLITELCDAFRFIVFIYLSIYLFIYSLFIVDGQTQCNVNNQNSCAYHKYANGRQLPKNDLVKKIIIPK